MTKNPHAVAWCRWFRSVGVPTEHIARIIDLELSEVDSRLAVRRRLGTPVSIPAWWYTKGSVRDRAIRSENGTYIRRLRELGYDVDQIAELMVLRPRAVADFLARTVSTRATPLVRPRTKAKQRQFEAFRPVRESRRARAAAKIAIHRERWALRDSRLDDEGASPAAVPPPAAELVDDQVEELAPAPEVLVPVPNLWSDPTFQSYARGERHGRARMTWETVRESRRLHAAGASINALARRFSVHPGTIRAIVRNETWLEVDAPEASAPVPPPAAELPTAKPRAKRRRWRLAAGTPLLYAKGSGCLYDD
jgi:DNA-binding transcriptional MerR regulator